MNKKLLGRADDRLVVDASMFIEFFILDTDDRFLELLRDLVNGEIVGILLRKGLRDQGPFRIIDLTGLGRDEGLLGGLADKHVRLVLHRLHPVIISAKIEHTQYCQYAREHQQ